MDTAATQDEYYVTSPTVIAFIHAAQQAAANEPDPQRRIEALKPAFAHLLASDDWLPDAYATPFAASGMGGGIGQYLLYRAAAGNLTLMSLVVPSGAATPVHDHLAWGLVGLYRGEQHEEVYAVTGGDADTGAADLVLTETRTLHAGEFYALLPPTDDIHRVITASPEASISIHLLGNDAGCVIRHRFEPDTGAVQPFRSGYSNRPCDTEE